MPWPAWLGVADAKAGTCYVRGHAFPEIISRHKPAGQAWRYRNKWTTYIPKRDLAYKNIDRLGPKSEEEFWNIMREARAADLSTPPTSAADLFLSVYRCRLAPGSLVRPFRGFRFGAWEQVFRDRLDCGEYHGKIYHYDLNRAYRWAASVGLPRLGTAHYTRDFTKPHAVYLVNLPFNVLPYHRAPSVAMLTSEERDMFSLDLEPLWGVAFRETVDISATFKKVDTLFPTSAKKISQHFWGMWGTPVAPEQVSWKRGERAREMTNPFFNPIWAHYVTSRVKMRLAVYWKYALRIYVDAIHSVEPLPVGFECGEWKLVGEHDGARFYAPNQWEPLTAPRRISRGSLKMLEDWPFVA